MKKFTYPRNTSRGTTPGNTVLANGSNGVTSSASTSAPTFNAPSHAYTSAPTFNAPSHTYTSAPTFNAPSHTSTSAPTFNAPSTAPSFNFFDNINETNFFDPVNTETGFPGDFDSPNASSYPSDAPFRSTTVNTSPDAFRPRNGIHRPRRPIGLSIGAAFALRNSRSKMIYHLRMALKILEELNDE